MNEPHTLTLITTEPTSRHWFHYPARYANDTPTELLQRATRFATDADSVWHTWRSLAPHDPTRTRGLEHDPAMLATHASQHRRATGPLPRKHDPVDGHPTHHYRPWDTHGNVDFNLGTSLHHDAYTLWIGFTTNTNDAQHLPHAYSTLPKRLRSTPSSHHDDAGDDRLGSAHLFWVEIDPNERPDNVALIAAVESVLEPWRRAGIITRPSASQILITETPFGYAAMEADRLEIAYIFIVRKTDVAIEHASAMLDQAMRPLTLADVKIRRLRAHLDHLMRDNAGVRARSEDALATALATTRSTNRDYRYDHIGAELRAIEGIATLIPEVSKHRDDLAYTKSQIDINRDNAAHHLRQVHHQRDRTALEDGVLTEARLAYRQAEADTERLDLLLQRASLELDAIRAAASVHTLRWEQTITLLLALFVPLGILQAFPEFGQPPETWLWLKPIAPTIRIIVLVLLALASVIAFSLAYRAGRARLNALLRRRRERSRR